MHNAKKYKQEKIDANFWEKEKIKVMLIEQTRKKISLAEKNYSAWKIDLQDSQWPSSQNFRKCSD